MRDVMSWLLDSDPALRWQVLRDLADAPAKEWETERARVATDGWGRRLLDLRGDDGWAHGACFPTRDWRPSAPLVGDPEAQPWTATLPTLRLLRDFGVDPHHPQVVAALTDVRNRVRWEYDGAPFFDGEVEPCINGGAVTLGAYFGQPVEVIVQRLLDDQLDDGGWNCEAERGSTRSSFHSTICVLEGLLEYERAGGHHHVTAARRAGEEYLLTRHLDRRLSTGEVVDPSWWEFSFPPQWYYDVLRGLDYFRHTGASPDPRLASALEGLRSKQQPDGTWLLENTHPGLAYFHLEDGDGQPSRWNILRAMRVLRWAGDASAISPATSR